MGSSIDSSRPAIRDITREDLGLPVFKRPEGCYRKDIKELWPAVADEHGIYQVLFAQEHLERPPAAHQALVPPNAIDALYAVEFERLDRALEANFGPPQAVPLSATGGSVAILGVVDMAAGGEVVFGSVLEEHELTGQYKVSCVL